MLEFTLDQYLLYRLENKCIPKYEIEKKIIDNKILDYIFQLEKFNLSEINELFMYGYIDEDYISIHNKILVNDHIKELIFYYQYFSEQFYINNMNYFSFHDKINIIRYNKLSEDVLTEYFTDDYRYILYIIKYQLISKHFLKFHLERIKSHRMFSQAYRNIQVSPIKYNLIFRLMSSSAIIFHLFKIFKIYNLA